MIELQNLSFSYNKNRTLFSDLSFRAEYGKIYGLLGKNGAGKTTLLKLTAGLLHPKKGHALINGYLSSNRHPGHLVSYYLMPEEFESPALSVAAYLRINSPFYPDFDHSQFKEYMQAFDMAPEGKINRFSYGQKKKFFLAFGLATNTPLFIADEPTNGLDIPSKSIFRKIIASALNEYRVFIISTHQVRDIEGLPDNISVIDKGRMIFNESLDTVSEKLLFVSGADDDMHNSEDLIYKEQSVGGSDCILKNTDGRFSKPNIELLFNALMQDDDTLQNLFN